MAKITLGNITTGYNLALINENFQDIQNALNVNVLWRTPVVGETNSMSEDIDANSFRVYNLPPPTTDRQPIRAVDLSYAFAFNGLTAPPSYPDLSGVTVPFTAASIIFTPTGTLASTNVQTAIQEVDTKVENLPNPIATVVTEAGTAKTLADTDASTYIRFTSTSPVTVTIPTMVGAIGNEFHLRQAATGLVTLVASGTTINTPFGGTLALAGLGATVTLKRVAVDTYDLMGQVGTA